jgi:hypothetical protein
MFWGRGAPGERQTGTSGRHDKIHAVSQAAWTLLGVVVGALISGVTQILLDWRRGRAERRKEAAAARAEIKVAARLVADEVDSLGPG